MATPQPCGYFHFAHRETGTERGGRVRAQQPLAQIRNHVVLRTHLWPTHWGTVPCRKELWGTRCFYPGFATETKILETVEHSSEEIYPLLA